MRKRTTLLKYLIDQLLKTKFHNNVYDCLTYSRDNKYSLPKKDGIVCVSAND